jgi:peptidoglycan LD-endopeptidase LytH
MMLARTFLPALGLALVFSACATGERLPHGTAGRGARAAVPVRSPAPASPRDDYARELASIGGDVLRAWEDASRRALRSGLSIAPSFRERVRFPADAPHAVAYRFPLREGQTLRIRITGLDTGGALFADMFHAIGGDLFRPVYSAPRRAREVHFTARITGEYVLRLQPQVDGGLFDIVVEGNSSLLFPVAGAGMRQVGGVFGDPRDGGRRRHEGVDIFAPRGTPVVAVTAGRVTQAGSTPIGGRVIWLADHASDLSYYYAHLHEIRVAEGAVVAAGDIIGTVGNTGNAAGTPPHLHFGAYRPGTIAVDPAPLLVYTAPLRALAVDDDLLGRWARTSAERVRLRTSPDLAAAVVTELAPATPLLVLGGVADWHRVLLADGTTGFLAAGSTQATGQEER